MFTGLLELWAIQYAIESSSAARPPTHRAMIHLIEQVGASLKYVIVDKLFVADMVYHAKLVISQNSRDVVIDIRPTDAIALAIEGNVPIFVANEVLYQLQDLQKNE